MGPRKIQRCGSSGHSWDRAAGLPLARIPRPFGAETPAPNMNEDPESTAEPALPAVTEVPVTEDLWARMMADVRSRFPKVTDGVAFCILKLEQNADLRLRDFKSEADLHDIKLSGRSFHSARVALGWEAPPVRRAGAVAAPADPRPEPVARPAASPRVEAPAARESAAITALREFEARNVSEVAGLRAAIAEVLAIVDTALEDE